jgi:4-hydroxy-tetrahydrodipicolinate synthase
MFKGSFVALITPFKDGVVDAAAYRDLVDWQIAEGTQGLVPCGTTGESPTLSHEEHRRVTEICIEVADGRVPVIAGAGSNSTQESLDLSRHAKAAGADGVLVVTPYYNKPTQEGMYQHFKAINDEVDIPIIIYNIPPRSVIDMSVATMARLAALPNIAGVKDATSDLNRPILTAIEIGPDFCQLSGEDGTAMPFLAGGGHGCISVTANIAPKMCADMQNAWAAGDVAAAMALQTKLMPVHGALFCETSPGPVKYAAGLLGICADEARLPMTEIAEASKARVRDALAGAGISR